MKCPSTFPPKKDLLPMTVFSTANCLKHGFTLIKLFFYIINNLYSRSFSTKFKRVTVDVSVNCVDKVF